LDTIGQARLVVFSWTGFHDQRPGHSTLGYRTEPVNRTNWGFQPSYRPFWNVLLSVVC